MATHEFQGQMAFFALPSAARPPTSRLSSLRMFVATALNRSRVRRPSPQPVAKWSEITGLCRSMIYQMEADRRFPQRIKISARAVGWLEKEVNAWLIRRIAASRSKTTI